MMKTILVSVAVFCFSLHHAKAQRSVFTENFESKSLDSSWHIINGTWQIADVQELRIAPADNGLQYVLCAEDEGFIRLIVDIPPNPGGTKIQFQFAYYTYSKGPPASLEIEFLKRQQKDGAKGKLFKTGLPVKGKWVTVKKVLTIPSGADSIYLVLEVMKATAKNSRTVCFDAFSITVLK